MKALEEIKTHINRCDEIEKSWDEELRPEFYDVVRKIKKLTDILLEEENRNYFDN